jgi:hypothetical protein
MLRRQDSRGIGILCYKEWQSHTRSKILHFQTDKATLDVILSKDVWFRLIAFFNVGAAEADT